MEEWVFHLCGPPRSKSFPGVGAGPQLNGDAPQVLHPNANGFDLLYAQLVRGGLIPGFPNHYRILPGKRESDLEFYSSTDLDADGGQIVGVALLKDELLEAGAIAGHPLSWKRGAEFAELDYPLDDKGHPSWFPLLPLFLESGLTFSTSLVLVTSRGEARAVQRLLTAIYFLRRGQQPIRSLIGSTRVLWPSARGSDNSSVLPGFASIPAFLDAPVDLRSEMLVDQALRRARAETDGSKDSNDGEGRNSGRCGYVLIVEQWASRVALHLMATNRASLLHRRAKPIRLALNMGAVWTGSCSRDLIAYQRMASSLSRSLKIDVTVEQMPR